MLGSLISAGTSLLGGLINSNATKKANEAAVRQNELAFQRASRDKEVDREYQERFARSGVQWRAEDARHAGIHPLYALGANVPTYTSSPISVGSPSQSVDTSLGSAVASMGQDISRGINATRSSEQRQTAFDKTVQDLTVQKMGLENTLLASQIKRLQVNSNPPFPGVASGPGGAQGLVVGGVPIKKDPNWSDAQTMEDRYGEFVSDILGPIIGWNDFLNTTGSRGVDTSSWPRKVGSAVWEGLKWADKNIKVFPSSRRMWTDPR